MLRRFIFACFITLIFLEIGSLFLLKIFVGKITSGDFIFRKTNELGLVIPNKEYVFPVKPGFIGVQESDEFSVPIKINRYGQRENHELRDDEIDIAFLGDSFTFGHGVSVEERYTNIFAKHSKYKKVTSFSYRNGFQPEHYEFFYKNNQNLRAKTIIVGLYLGNDLGGDLLGTRLDIEKNELELPFIQILENGQRRIRQNAYIFPISFLRDSSNFIDLLVRAVSRTQYKKYIFISELDDGTESTNIPSLDINPKDLSSNRAVQSLIRLKAEVENRNARLLVLLIPQNWYFSDTNPHIHESLKGRIGEIRGGKNIKSEMLMTCVQVELDCFDPSSVLRAEHYFQRDAHWNAAGHEAVGKALALRISKF